MGDGTKRKKQISKVITSGYIFTYDHSMGILRINNRGKDRKRLAW